MSENIEITLNGVNVSRCKHLNDSKDGLLCTLYDYGVFYDMRCSDNPDCYYKQLQHTTIQYNKLVEQNKSIQTEIISLHEKIECLKYVAKISNNGLIAVTDKAIKLAEDNKVLTKTLKKIAEIAKAKVYAPVCFEDPDCPKNGGVGFDNDCDECCPILTIEKILEKIKEVENERQV